MRERDFQTKFGKWLKHIHKQTGAFELKLVSKTSMPFSAVADHQVDALWNAKHGVLVYKIPDAGYQNPFDTISLVGIPAYIVIKYKGGMVYMIDIDEYIRETKRSLVRSINERRAKELSLYHFNIKSYNTSDRPL